MIIAPETSSPARYSILPCPKGCSGSGFLPANLKPIIEIIDEPASDRLLKASAVIAMEALNTPAMYLIIKRTRFKNIP